jgi:membrane associated rhomboid family serine protease
MNTHPKIIGFVVVTLGVLTAFYIGVVGALMLMNVKPEQSLLSAFSHIGDGITGAFIALLINTRQQTPPPPDTTKETTIKETTTPPVDK